MVLIQLLLPTSGTARVEGLAPLAETRTDTFDRAWWRAYAATLAERSGQETIHLRAVPVDMLDEGDR